MRFVGQREKKERSERLQQLRTAKEKKYTCELSHRVTESLLGKGERHAPEGREKSGGILITKRRVTYPPTETKKRGIGPSRDRRVRGGKNPSRSRGGNWPEKK